MQERFQMFTVLITKINRSIRRIKTEEMAEFELKSPHVSCLYYLYKSKSLTAKELCDICEEDKAAVSRSIEYLEENGYIVCRSKAQKRYRTPLELSEKGRTAGSRIVEKIDRILERASEGICDADRQIMYQSLARISDNLQAVCNEYEQKNRT